MYARDYLVTECTLMGAVDSFLKSVVHVRPQLVNGFEEIAEAWIDSWFEAGGANTLEAIDRRWLQHYVEQRGNAREEVERFLHTFYAWAVKENLVDASPLN